MVNSRLSSLSQAGGSCQTSPHQLPSSRQALKATNAALAKSRNVFGGSSLFVKSKEDVVAQRKSAQKGIIVHQKLCSDEQHSAAKQKLFAHAKANEKKK